MLFGGLLMKSYVRNFSSLALAVCICSTSLTEATEPYRVVAASGGLSGVGNSTFTNFVWGAAFDPAGRISVRAETTGATGIWIEQPGSLAPALLWPGTAPGFPTGATIDHFSKFGPIAQSGYSTAIGSVVGGGLTGNTTGLFVSGPDGTFRLAERSGQPANDMPGVTVLPQGLDTLSNRDGDLLVQGQFIGGPLFGAGKAAIWLERGLGPELAFYTGMPAPGFSAGVVLQTTVSSKFGIEIDNDQRIAYGGVAGTSKGIWLFDPDAPVTTRLVARTEPTSTVTTFSQLSDLQLTQDRVVFQATVNSPGLIARTALLAETNGTLETIAKAGDLAPGLGPTDLFDVGTSFTVSNVAVNDQGNIAFAATTRNSLAPSIRNAGIWLDTPIDDPKLVLKSTDLPGNPSFVLAQLVMNDNGQMAFVLASGVPSVWFFDPVLGAQRVVSEGDVLSLILNGQSVSRTIDDIQVGTFQNDHLAASNYLSDSGQVVFVATFREGGTAVLAWSPVPEPGAAGLMASAFTSCFWMRRSRRDP